MLPNLHKTADLVTLTVEILNEKLHFLCRASALMKQWHMQFFVPVCFLLFNFFPIQYQSLSLQFLLILIMFEKYQQTGQSFPIPLELKLVTDGLSLLVSLETGFLKINTFSWSWSNTKNTVKNMNHLIYWILMEFFGKRYKDLIYNLFHNILKLFDVWPNFAFTTSETMRNYYL